MFMKTETIMNNFSTLKFQMLLDSLIKLSQYTNINQVFLSSFPRQREKRKMSNLLTVHVFWLT